MKQTPIHNNNNNNNNKRIDAYIDDRVAADLTVDGERLTAFLFLVQSIMLACFAVILGSHRSEILDQKINLEEEENMAEVYQVGDGEGTYEAPRGREQRTVV
jgi:hypothetical protein